MMLVAKVQTHLAIQHYIDGNCSALKPKNPLFRLRVLIFACFKLIFPLAMKWVSEPKLARNNVSRPKEGAGPN